MTCQASRTNVASDRLHASRSIASQSAGVRLSAGTEQFLQGGVGELGRVYRGNRDGAAIGAGNLVIHLVPPLLPTAILQPEDAGGRVRRAVLPVLGIDRSLGPGRHEDLHRVVAVARGPLVQAALHPVVGLILPGL